VLEVFVGKGIQFVCESAREHPLDFRLPGRFLELLMVKEFFHAGDVALVQFDPDVMRKFIPLRGCAGGPMNLALGIAMRWRSKARSIESCLTTEFTR
jgi:hypothetical protein